MYGNSVYIFSFCFLLLKKRKKEKKGFVAYVGSFSFYFSFGTKIVLSWFTKVINCV